MAALFAILPDSSNLLVITFSDVSILALSIKYRPLYSPHTF
ncbi:hypothetical protein GAMM_60305 [Gammaproteobacteria bacterium]